MNDRIESPIKQHEHEKILRQKLQNQRAIQAQHCRLYGADMEHAPPEYFRPWHPPGLPQSNPLPPKVVLLRWYYPVATTSPAYVAGRDNV